MDKGVIVKALSGFYYVETGAGLLECRARGKIRLEGLSPLVGDEVIVEPLENGKGSLREVLPRRNSFVRPAVANIDCMVILASAVIPVTDPFLIDRLAAIAELKGCEPFIVLNKADLDPAEELYAIYSGAGFPTFRVSAATGEGTGALAEALRGRTCAFTGNSGVGKSSLLNALEPRFAIETGDVSRKLGRGRHTTRHVEMFRLSNGCLAIDTPGFASFDAEDVDLELKRRLPELFRDFAPYLGGCRFSDCAHLTEPGCTVLEALREGRIHPSRHASYARLHEQLKSVKEWEKQGAGNR
jgi:ribosome biogenesis GTPase